MLLLRNYGAPIAVANGMSSMPTRTVNQLPDNRPCDAPGPTGNPAQPQPRRTPDRRRGSPLRRQSTATAGGRQTPWDVIA
jgi:hypothetical protein